MFWIYRFWFAVCVFIHIITAREVGEKCQPNEKILDGVCSHIDQCPEAISQIRTHRTHSFQRCGFDGMNEVVCCPSTGPRFGTTTQRSGDTRGNPTPTTGQRIADIECNKIVNSSLPPLDLHIIGGERASRGEFPHMVALGFMRQSGYEFDCGGSLISDRYVLTAAHCVDTKDQIEPTIARIGVIKLGAKEFDPETDVRIEAVIKHPDYTRVEKYDDLALLKLSQPVEPSSYLAPVCLYTSAGDPRVPLTVTGWGTTSTIKDMRSDTLLKANVTVVGRERCDESYAIFQRRMPRGVVASQICAGDPEGAHDTCQGDSGGPLQGLTAPDGFYRLVGVTSFGRGCGSPVPGVYTRVAAYLDWIESVVWPQ